MLSSVRKPPPLVTGLSPKEGPPGTRVTIRGENLGIDARDLIALRICGVDCLLSAEWQSPNKIIARTGQVKGKGDIIVVTRSGGVGSCTVTFKGYFQQTGPLVESAVFVNEDQMVVSRLNRNRMSAPLSATEHDDPLGISDESNDSKFPDEELHDMFPEGSGNTSDENFVPQWFLLENHHGTSFDDLKAGLAYLKRKSSQRHEGPLAFVKANLTTFMDCQNTLADMHNQLVEDQKNANGSITLQLVDILEKSNKSADLLFQDVLRRKDRADATRNALGVLHRFKFLFNLPCSIERNIKKGDFDLVITDYTRAKSLFGDTEVQVFKKFYNEVENRIASFREMLNNRLLQLPSSVDEQKRLIRYLVHLESPGDPAWDCLDNMQKWLVKLLHTCKEQHIAKENEGDKENGEKSETSSPSRSLKAPTVTREPSFKSGGKAPHKVQFVDNLSRILTDHLPDLWRLGQSYFSGKLFKEAKDKTSKINTSKHGRFKQMIQEVVKLYSCLIRAAFLPESLENVEQNTRQRYGVWRDNKRDSPIAWLPICVRYVRICALQLASLDLPSDSSEILQELAFDMRTSCMSTLFKNAIEDIKNLHQRETWTVDSNDEQGGTTLLPALFESIVNETVQHLHEVILARPGESQVFDQRPIQIEAVHLTTELLQAFAGTLEQLAVCGNVERETTKRSAIRPDIFAGHADAMPSLSIRPYRVIETVKDKRLMIMLSNCHHTLHHILPRLMENLDRHGYPETDKVLQEEPDSVSAQQTYVDLDAKLFEAYIEEKTNPIVGGIEQNMYSGNFDWNDCHSLTGVRRYIKDALMGMIEVHAEVYAISPHFVPRVMYRVVDAVVEELTRLVQCVTGFNPKGALQARLELYAMEIAIGAYKTEETNKAFEEALECLPPNNASEDKKLLEDHLNKFRVQMRFQLMCFQHDLYK